ncbi:uncharacterized protein LOC111106261 [Crassostrea virginica]
MSEKRKLTYKVKKDSDKALEMLDVRFLDEKESRIQRAFDGLSNITIPCERDSTMKEWMALCFLEQRNNNSEALLEPQDNPPKSIPVVDVTDSEDEFQSSASNDIKREEEANEVTPKTSTPISNKLPQCVNYDSDCDLACPEKKTKVHSDSDCELPEITCITSKNKTKEKDRNHDLSYEDNEEELECVREFENDENEKNLQDDEGVMNNLKEYEEMMQKKKERKAFADSTFIKFPSLEEPSIRVSVIYESHGGLSINRPFKVTETLSSIYTWILSEVEPEILPPVFHLECRKPSSCEQSNCPHIWELEKAHSKKITELPPVLFLREGNFSANDTLTGFGDVLFSELA